LKLEIDKYYETKLISKMDIYFEMEGVIDKLTIINFFIKWFGNRNFTI